MKTGICLIMMMMLVLSVGTVIAAPHGITPWRGNHPGAVSLTFDAGYAAQYTFAVPALNERGIKGTFFLVTDFTSAPPPGNLVTWDNWKTVAGMGHEIGSLSVSHSDLTTLSPSDAEKEIATSQALINSYMPNQKCVSFSYPYGILNPAVKALVQQYYIGASGATGVLNDSTTDSYNEGAYDVNNYSVSQLEDLTAQAASQGKWLIPVFYSFDPTQYGRWTIDELATYMDYLKARSDLWIAPFGTVMKYMRERGTAMISVSSQTSDQITLILSDTLDDTTFDCPLTLRSEVPANWTRVKVQQGTTVTILSPVVEGGSLVVYYDAVPDRGVITLTPEVSPPPVEALHEITPWRDNHAGAVSLTFDDGYATHYSFAVPALNERGLKGTFFLVTNFTSAPPPNNLITWDEWNGVAAMGHEIGSHSLSHPDLTTLSASDAENEIATSRTLIDTYIPNQKCFSFAYPFGNPNNAVEALVQKYYVGARGTVGALNGSSTDMFNEAAYDVSSYTVSQMEDLSAQAMSQGKWLIPAFHSFDPTQYGGWTTDQFLAYIDYLHGRTDVWVAPFGTVMKYLRERSAATLTVSSQTSDKITLNLTDTLDDTVFDCPLTLKSKVPANWTTVNVQQGTTVTSVSPLLEGTRWVVYYDVLPDRGVITLTSAAANLSPVATNDSYSTNQNTPLSVSAPGVLDNDVDPEGAILTAQLVTGPSHGTLTLNADGSFSYIPFANYVGNDSFTYTASDGTNSSNVATVTVSVLPKLDSLDLNITAVTGGGTSRGTVILSAPAPTGGTIISLSSNSSAASVPLTVTVPASSTSATFTITTIPVANTVAATISAAFGGVTKTATLTVNPAMLSMLSLAPGSVVGGKASQGTVTLNAPAPSEGVVVSLGSDSPAATVPATVTIPALATTAVFTITTTPVASAAPAIISAAYGGVTKTATLTVNPALLNTLSLAPSTVVGGTTSQGTVTLNAPAPSGGAIILLSSDSSAASVPLSVTVPAFSTSATFTITTHSVGSSSLAAISATYGTVTKTTMLTVNPPALASLSVSPASVRGGGTSQGTVMLSGPAPSGGAVVALSDNSSVASVPASVTVAEGSTSATFPITTYRVTTSKSVTIYAAYGAVTRKATLKVTR